MVAGLSMVECSKTKSILVKYKLKSSKFGPGEMDIPVEAVETCSSDVKSLNLEVLYALRIRKFGATRY